MVSEETVKSGEGIGEVSENDTKLVLLVKQDDGEIGWYNGKGNLHRLTGPALTIFGGLPYEVWFKDGEIHRDGDEPAVIYQNGTKHWYKNGFRHRENGPASVSSDGWEEWFQNGLLHRLNGPAYTCDGNQKWFRRGKFHRLDGPAVIYKDGDREWWIDGEQFTVEQWREKVVSFTKINRGMD